MRPFLLLGDITGWITLAGCIVLAAGGIMVFGAVKSLQRSAPADLPGRFAAGLLLLVGCIVLVVGLMFLGELALDSLKRPFN